MITTIIIIIITGGSGSGKVNTLLGLIIHKPDNDEQLDFYAKDPYKTNHHLLIKKHKSVG